VGNMVKSWALKGEGNLSKINVWTGAHDSVQCGDFVMLPPSGLQRSGHTFTSERVDGVWKHRIFVSVSDWFQTMSGKHKGTHEGRLQTYRFNVGLHRISDQIPEFTSVWPSSSLQLCKGSRPVRQICKTIATGFQSIYLAMKMSRPLQRVLALGRQYLSILNPKGIYIGTSLLVFTILCLVHGVLVGPGGH
jgi:hypothetical protein